MSTALAGESNRTVVATVQAERWRYRLRRTAVVAATAVVVATASVAAADRVDRAGQVTPASPAEVPAVPPTTAAPDPEPEPGTQAPAGAARLVVQTPARVLDTRTAGETPPPADTAFSFPVEPDRSAVALSVSVLGTERDGSVQVDGRQGVVEAVRIPRAGATTTNLVIVPLAPGTGEGEVTVRSSAGGHLTVDVVGTFEPVAGPVRAGRFVSVDPIRISDLETATEGRQSDLSFNDAGIGSSPPGVPVGVSALLVAVDADVGADGGVVRLGTDHEHYDQMLMWAAALDDNKQRRALALVEPTSEGLAALRYDGGSRLTLDVIGYFTDESAEPALDGLFVPAGPRAVYEGPLGPGTEVEIAGLSPEAQAALVTVGSRAGVPGQLGSALLQVERGTVAVTTAADVEGVVTLLGEFWYQPAILPGG
jgi:hypothetical protein